MRKLLWTMLMVATLAGSAEAQIVFKGGDGNSLAQAVLIMGAEGETDGVAAEYAWLDQHYPGYIPGDQALVQQGDRLYDILTIRWKGKTLELYFDITTFFGKM
jgi:hypothetical protein